ncbi:MAG: hypothetical protein O2816_20130 [Planctomycetota bacterium]|nr:hypothetical protein [Planctomycetota bacterium]
MPPKPTERREARAAGLVVLAAVVVVGMGMPALYRWWVPVLKEQKEKALAEAPSESEALVGRWFEMLQPQVVHVLHMCRFSSSQPWLVSHVMRPRSAEEPPEVWGMGDDEVGPGSVVLDGMAVRVVLPAPRVIARDVLVGDNALGVQVYDPDHPPEDPRALLRNRVEFVLKKHMAALEKDIPGAYLSVEVGGLVRPRPVRTHAQDPETGSGD